MSLKIVLMGKFGSGKNLFLELAQQHFPKLKFVEGKFATPLYELQGLIQNHLGIEPHKDGKLLQFLGSHIKKEEGSEFFVDWFFNRLGSSNTIITDCRFINEITKCKEQGFYLVKINRQYELRANNQGNRDPNHPSEAEIDSIKDSTFDYIINNNASLDLFEGAVINVVSNILRSHEKTVDF